MNAFWNPFLAVLLILIALFLILLVLVQRGRGGGLAGALGGMGGQSAFGTKAGDTFTRITIVAAALWILVSLFSVKKLSTTKGPLGDADAALPPVATAGAVDAPGGPASEIPAGPAGDPAGTSGEPADTSENQ